MREFEPIEEAGCGCTPQDHCQPDDAAAAVSCATPRPRGWLGRVFGRAAACTCGSAGAFALSHVSCVVTPLVLAFTGAAMTGIGGSLLALGIGAAVTAGGLAVWNKLRGAAASRAEKRIVIGGAVIGFALSAVFHLSAHRQHGSTDPRAGREVISCGVPASAPRGAGDTAIFNKPR